MGEYPEDADKDQGGQIAEKGLESAGNGVGIKLGIFSLSFVVKERQLSIT
jgi:hypothetical protein